MVHDAAGAAMTRWSAALLLTLAVVVSLALMSFGGGGGNGPRPVRATLGWDGTPQLTSVPQLPRDRILSGRLANESLRTAELDVEDVTVLDAAGRQLRSTVRFASAFAHGLFSAESINRYGKPGEGERQRLGEIATVNPGESVPITLSWRLRPDGTRATAVQFGASRVTLP
jgi:hypothetical protein